MRSIHSRHYIYTHWLRIDLNNDEIKQWEQLKDYWNKYDCSMTVYYYDYNPLTEKAIKFAMNNKKTIHKTNNQYVYDNDKIINKIERIIEEHKKHPDRTGKILI